VSRDNPSCPSRTDHVRKYIYVEQEDKSRWRQEVVNASLTSVQIRIMLRRENWLTERSGISKTIMVKYQNINYKLQIFIVTLIKKNYVSALMLFE